MTYLMTGFDYQHKNIRYRIWLTRIFTITFRDCGKTFGVGFVGNGSMVIARRTEGVPQKNNFVVEIIFLSR